MEWWPFVFLDNYWILFCNCDVFQVPTLSFGNHQRVQIRMLEYIESWLRMRTKQDIHRCNLDMTHDWRVLWRDLNLALESFGDLYQVDEDSLNWCELRNFRFHSTKNKIYIEKLVDLIMIIFNLPKILQGQHKPEYLKVR